MRDGMTRSGRVVRHTWAALAVLALSAGALVALSTPASAGGNMNVVVDKVVVGTAPAGTTFTVHFECDGTGPSGALTFDANGDPSPAFSNFFNDGDLGSTCTITEHESGGAANVAISCEDDGVNASCLSSGNQVTFDSPSNTSNNVRFTITNAFANALPDLSVSSLEAEPGETVTVSGEGCTKELFGGSADTGGSVVVTVGFPTPLVLTTTAEGTTGAWSVEFTVPDGTDGPYTINAECGDPVPYAEVTLTVLGAVAAVVVPPTFTG